MAVRDPGIVNGAPWWQTPQGQQLFAQMNPGLDVDRWVNRERTRSTSFYERAQAMFPGLPEWVLMAYARGLQDNSGNAELAWQRVRQNNNYDKTFAGNRREDGSFRMTEMEYLATKDGYRQMLRDYGLNADLFESRFPTLIEGDVSLNEFNTRLDAVWNGVQSATQETREKFQQWYGAAYNPELAKNQPSVALAMALDPDVGQQVLAKRITFAQIGGEASRAGFGRSLRRVQQLARQGLTGESARSLYGQAASQLGVLNALAVRHNDADSTFGLSEFESAALGDVGQQQRAQRLVNAEVASFGGGGRVARDQTGGLSGLEQQ